MQHSAQALAYAELILTNPLCEVTNPVTGRPFVQVGPFWLDPWQFKEALSWEDWQYCYQNR
jgi:hypothetical protein